MVGPGREDADPGQRPPAAADWGTQAGVERGDAVRWLGVGMGGAERVPPGRGEKEHRVGRGRGGAASERAEMVRGAGPGGRLESCDEEPATCARELLG